MSFYYNYYYSIVVDYFPLVDWLTIFVLLDENIISMYASADVSVGLFYNLHLFYNKNN